MPTRKMSRPPETVYEHRINFPKISSDQARRTEAGEVAIERWLRKVEKLTVAWADDQLGKRKAKTAINKFVLPGKVRLRRILRSRLHTAALDGAFDVASELGGEVTPFKISEVSRTRARADALFDEMVNWLESNLKRVWSQAMLGNIDRAQLRYLTRQQFAIFAGWPDPTP